MVDSNEKGNRGERALVKLLNRRFGTGAFSRVVGSGNRWSHVSYVSKDYISDIICPDNFKFAVECKFGYDFSLSNCLFKNSKQLDSFLEQATADARRLEKPPFLCWKKNYQPWVAVFERNLLSKKLNKYMQYNDWIISGLDDVFALPDSFFLIEDL